MRWNPTCQYRLYINTHRISRLPSTHFITHTQPNNFNFNRQTHQQFFNSLSHITSHLKTHKSKNKQKLIKLKKKTNKHTLSLPLLFLLSSPHFPLTHSLSLTFSLYISLLFFFLLFFFLLFKFLLLTLTSLFFPRFPPLCPFRIGLRRLGSSEPENKITTSLM